MIRSIAPTASKDLAVSHKFFRELHRLELLGLLAPEVEAVIHQVHYDARHAFTTGVHCIETLEALDDLWLGALEKEETHLTRIAGGILRPWVVRLAALCHDLGKKEVPREILNRNGPLEPNEWLLMEKHPSSGARLLLDIPGVESANPLLPVVAYQHHMGANQSGYPKVLDRVPQYPVHFISLLVAVADVYDALRTVRPHRPAMTVAKAATILIRDALAGKLHKEYVSSFLLTPYVVVKLKR